MDDTNALVAAVADAIAPHLAPNVETDDVARAATAALLRALAEEVEEAEENDDIWPTSEDLVLLADEMDGAYLDPDEIALGRRIVDVQLPEPKGA